MKLLCLIELYMLVLFSNINVNSQSIAFYYGKDFLNPTSLIYDIIVVQPDNLPSEMLKENPSRYYAYISIGEFKDDEIKKFSIGYRDDWKSYIGDIRKKEYRDYLFWKIKKIKEKGFINFFFDNLDSYKLVVKNMDEENEYKKSIIEFIRDFKSIYPNSDIILNRPLDMLEEVRKFSDKIVAESLYYGINTKTKECIKMKDDDTKWLKEKLNRAKNLGYTVYVIDYIPASNQKLRTKIARKILSDGFIPYISDPMLSEWGSNEYEKIKRDVLLIYDSDVYPDPVFSTAHRIFSLPLEYYGYRPNLRDVKNLPEDPSIFAAVIFVEIRDSNLYAEKVFKWIKKAIESETKVLFLSEFPIKEHHLQKLKINTTLNNKERYSKFEEIERDECIGFETEPSLIDRIDLVNVENSEILLSYKTPSGKIHHSAAITPWGGYILKEAFIKYFGNFEVLAFDPFCFFRKAFINRKYPIPDVTTLNGKRVLFIHIDGDGFSSFYENLFNNKYASEVLFEEILLKYKIPHSVSIIRGEIEHPQLDNENRQRLKDVARKIFLLPYVEVGNHSYSHPFRWIDIKNADEFEHIEQVYNISIPGYNFSINEEIIGTKKWLEDSIIPEKKNEIFFWTGDCIAPYSALKLLNQNSMLNINGGNTSATYSRPFLSLISPYGIERSGFYQVYASQQNENIYTNLWTGPFKGYEKVIETFNITEKPRRLKPINIYYHFYSASKYESLKALKKVYDYALSQNVVPQFTSDYVKSVIDFYNLEIFNYGDSWIVASNGNLKTLRISDGYPEINSSVCGYAITNNQKYVNLCGKPPYRFRITADKNNNVYVESVNAFIDEFKIGNNDFFIRFKGYVPIRYRLENYKNYKIMEKDFNLGNLFVKEIYGKR